MRNLVQPENLVKLLKLLLRYILTIIRHIDFKSGNINFQKDRKQPAKYKQNTKFKMTLLLSIILKSILKLMMIISTSEISVKRESTSNQSTYNLLRKSSYSIQTQENTDQK